MCTRSAAPGTARRWSSPLHPSRWRSSSSSSPCPSTVRPPRQPYTYADATTDWLIDPPRPRLRLAVCTLGRRSD
eukprot:638769-Prorocentrum_minimum.AAC.1